MLGPGDSVPDVHVVAVVVYLVAWALSGTFGLLLGWIPAAALGLFAAREIGRRAAS